MESNAPAEFVIESQVEAVLENVIQVSRIGGWSIIRETGGAILGSGFSIRIRLVSQDVAKNHIVTEKSTSLPPPGLGPAYCADDSSASTGHDIWRYLKSHNFVAQ